MDIAPDLAPTNEMPSAIAAPTAATAPIAAATEPLMADQPPTGHPRPSAPSANPGPSGAAGRSWLRRAADDAVYLLTGFPLALASFVVLVVGLATSLGLLIIWVGVPLLVLTLVAARGFAAVERVRLRARGDQVGPGAYRPAVAGPGSVGRGLIGRGALEHLRDRQSWLDLLHGIVVFPLATVTWSAAVAWVAVTGGGLTGWIWLRFIPDTDDNETLVELLDLAPGGWTDRTLGFSVGDELLYLVIGVVGLALMAPAFRLLATPQAALGRVLLANPRVAELQAELDALRGTQAAAADAELADRLRLERDIHDGPQQRLVRLGMDLAAAERRLGTDPDGAKELLAEARQQSNAALDELRLLSRGIAPPLLTDRGLSAALEDQAARAPVPTTLADDLPAGTRLPARIERALYFTAAEALTNVAKHAGATRAHIEVRRTADPTPAVVLAVVDDGVGGAAAGKGHGLDGLRDRLALLDGTLTITSPPGGPTRLEASVPCGS